MFRRWPPDGSKGALTSTFVFLRVRPAGRRITPGPDGALPERWLIAQWPDDEPEPVTYWLSSQPADTQPADLIRTAKIRWRIEHDYRELETGLGLDHFEGRSFTGWRRHVTLVTTAYLFITMLRHDPKADAPAWPSTRSSASCNNSSRPGPAHASPATNPWNRCIATNDTEPNKALLARQLGAGWHGGGEER
jgi:hypothetical protein